MYIYMYICRRYLPGSGCSPPHEHSLNMRIDGHGSTSLSTLVCPFFGSAGGGGISCFRSPDARRWCCQAITQVFCGS